MSDRELLEAAAKAAGIEVRVDTLRDGSGVWRMIRLVDDGWQVWNPLTSNDDAVNLLLAFEHGGFAGVYPGHASCSILKVGGGEEYVMEYETDGPAAFRRAIVRAAAAMTPTDALSQVSAK